MLKRIPYEALCWLTGLSLLAFLDSGDISHFTLCPLKNLGLDFCPGCGLGKSISLLFHGEFNRSLAAHPVGIFAVIILSLRIFTLTKQYFQNYGKSY